MFLVRTKTSESAFGFASVSALSLPGTSRGFSPSIARNLLKTQVNVLAKKSAGHTLFLQSKAQPCLPF